jgi:hypothetical protein
MDPPHKGTIAARTPVLAACTSGHINVRGHAGATVAAKGFGDGCLA